MEKPAGNKVHEIIAPYKDTPLHILTFVNNIRLNL